MKSFKQMSIIALLTVLVTAFSPGLAVAQFNVGIDAGASSKAPTASLHISYIVPSNNFVTPVMEYDQRVHLNSIDPAYFGFRCGTALQFSDNTKYLMPVVGGYYRWASADNPALNAWALGTGVRYIHKHASGEVFYVDKTYSVTIGFVGFISRWH